MDTVHAGHRDPLHVLLLDPHVGALDGDRDAAVQGAVARDDLREETPDKSEDFNGGKLNQASEESGRRKTTMK